MWKQNLLMCFVNLFIASVVYFVFTDALIAAELLPECTPQKPVVTVTTVQPFFIVKLPSNPTTGFSWFLQQYNNMTIEPIRHVFLPATNKKLVGAAGMEAWYFRAKTSVVPQQFFVELVYARPFEFKMQTEKFLCQISFFPTSAKNKK